jgi:hypothetical protein
MLPFFQRFYSPWCQPQGKKKKRIISFLQDIVSSSASLPKSDPFPCGYFLKYIPHVHSQKRALQLKEYKK